MSLLPEIQRRAREIRPQFPYRERDGVPGDCVPSHSKQSHGRMFPSAPMGLKIGSGAISVSKSRAVNSFRAFIQI